jgi:hypothetical protein
MSGRPHPLPLTLRVAATPRGGAALLAALAWLPHEERGDDVVADSTSCLQLGDVSQPIHSADGVPPLLAGEGDRG